MTSRLRSAVYITASILLSCSLSNAQNSAVNDSLSVFWEQLDGPSAFVLKYAESAGRIYAATQTALFSSTDGGQNWKFNKALGRRSMETLFADDDVVLAVETHKTGDEANTYVFDVNVWRSENGGASWSKVMSIPILRKATSTIDFAVTDIAALDNTHFGFVFRDGQEYTLFESADNGATWAEVGPPSPNISSIVGLDGRYSGLWHSGLGTPYVGFVSENSAFSNFQNINIPLSYQPKILRAAQCGGAFRLFLDDHRMVYTQNGGANWEETLLDVPAQVADVELTPTDFFLITPEGVWQGAYQAPNSLLKIYDGQFGLSKYARLIQRLPSGYWVNTDFGQTICLANNQSEWKVRSAGLLGRVERLGAKCGQIYAQSGTTYPDSRTSLLLSSPQDGEWESLSSTDNSWDIEFDMPLGEWGGYLWTYSPPRLCRSHDCGATWDTLYQLVLGASASGIVGQGNRMYVYSNSDFNLHYTDDFGESWISIPLPSFQSIGKLIVKGDTLIAVPSGGYVSALDFSIDGGQSWDIMNITLPNTGYLQTVFGDGTKLIGVTRQTESNPEAQVFVSTNMGLSWTRTFHTSLRYAISSGLGGGATHFPFYSQGMLFMHSNNRMHISSDAGLHWTTLLDVPFTNQLPLNFVNQWWLGYTPVSDTLVQGAAFYFVNDGYLYAATEAQGVWRTELAPIHDHALVAGGKFGLLNGQLYRDEDSNCAYNAVLGDIPLGHKPLTIQPGNISAITDANGKYTVALPPGSYTVQATAPTYHVSACNVLPSHTISAGMTTVADLAFQPTPGLPDLCVLLTTPVRARPGFLVNYKVQVNNIGTTTVSGATLHVLFDNNWLEPLSIVPFGQFAANQAVVDLPDLSPGQVLIVTLNFGVSVNVPLGTDLSITALCELAEDVQPSNNRAAATQTVTGSYDPNDKTAQPVQAQLPYQPRTFDYLIRFQNTGTDTAFTVVVTDTLDAQFDLMSLRNVESSHPFEFRMLPGRVAKWIFRNILLPDSNTNEVASHGYIRFQLETLPDALPGVSIANDADIFFDFNSPVRTNESLAENPKWVVTYHHEARLCEGDTWNGLAWNENAIVSDTIQALWSDTVTITQVIVWPTWHIEKDTTLLAGESIFGQPVWQDTLLEFQYQTTEGCDSTLVWHITVITSGLESHQSPDAAFSVVPNPAAQEAWLRFTGVTTSGNSVWTVRILDGAGRVWKRSEVEGRYFRNGIKLDIESMPSGVYFVEVYGPGFNKTCRLVKI